MKKLLQITLLLVPQVALALSCSGSGSKNLADPGGSLHPLRVTNQNGLGICHIEQLFKLIKAKLPGHPDLSRVQLAIAEKRVRDSKVLISGKNAVRWTDKNGVGGTYIDAGNTCDAYNLIKGQSICPAANDRFEQLTKQNPDNQEKIIETLSSYFDQRKSTPLGSMFMWNSSMNVRIEAAMRACPTSVMAFTRLKSAYQRHLQANLTALGPNLPTTVNFAKNLSVASLQMTPYQFMSNESYSHHLKALLGGSHLSPTSQTGIELQASIAAYAQDMESKESCIAEKIKMSVTEGLCYMPLAKSTNDMLNLTTLGLNVREITAMLQGDYDRDRFFSDAFSCGSYKVVIPSNISCNKTDLTAYWSTAKTENEYHAKVDPIIEARIKKGIPVGVSSCTRYFRNPNARTVQIGTKNFNCGDNKAKDFSKGEGSHAMTIIGSRCKNGEKQYLVQNSWGAGCSYYDKSYECTGKGGYWAPASVVLNNTRGLNILE